MNHKKFQIKIKGVKFVFYHNLLEITNYQFSINFRLTATGYLCYLRSVHQFVNEHWHSLPYRKELLQLSPQYLSLLVLATFLVSMLWKAYCISIVWRCYKYLTLRQQAMRSTVHYILPGEGSERGPEPDYSTLLPDYEQACASAMKQAPPPSYQAAMEGHPPAYPEVILAHHVITLATEAPALIPQAEVVNENAATPTVENEGN